MILHLLLQNRQRNKVKRSDHKSGKWALIINGSQGEDCGAQWCKIYWGLSVCQGQESTAPLEMSKEQRNTDICVHSWGTELISDVFWPNTCNWLVSSMSSTAKTKQPLGLRDSTFLIRWLVHSRFSHIPGLKQSHENLALLPNGPSTIISILNWTPPSMVPWESGTTLSNS